MARINSYPTGIFSWIDLMTPSADASQKFYSELFGWSVLQNPTDQGGVYCMFQQEGLDICGMGEMGEEMKKTGMPAVWNSYVTVDDADAAVARAVELGATVDMPVMQVMDAGRMAILVDPVGARFCLWEKGDHFGAGFVNEPNSLCWNELSTREPQKACDFYGSLFDWSFDESDGYNQISSGGRPNGGIRTVGSDEPEMPAWWMAYISVADCDETVARVTMLGGRVIAEPIDIESGRFSLVADPQGAIIAVMKVNQPD
jgi:predicted enzyme related to lactoylglutathione lyase